MEEKEAWLNDMGIIYEEWRGLQQDFARSSRNQTAAQENPKLSIRNNKLGMAVPDKSAASLAGHVPFGNPFNSEQEEGEATKSKIERIQEYVTTTLQKLDPRKTTDMQSVILLKTIQKILG